MAKRKRKSRASSSSGYSSFGGIAATGIGVAAYILFEAYVEPKITGYIGNDMLLNVAEIAAGAYLARKGGWVGAVGKTAVVINLYQLIKPLVAGV